MDNEPTILIVDDDPNLTKTLSDIVRLQGYRPLAAAKGKTALDKVKKEESPSVALIDLKLPDMDGLEVMRESKKRSPDTECIVLTGYGSRASAIEAVNLGAYGYIQKPYDVEQLIVTVQRAVEKREAREVLRESEERLGAFMDSAPDAFALFDSELNLVEMNKAASEMLPAGIKKEDVIGKNILEIAPGLKETGRYDRYLRVIETGEPCFIEDVVPVGTQWGCTGGKRNLRVWPG